jgi:hypothetical protein
VNSGITGVLQVLTLSWEVAIAGIRSLFIKLPDTEVLETLTALSTK